MAKVALVRGGNRKENIRRALEYIGDSRSTGMRILPGNTASSSST